jgi:hypothetical protein
MRTTELLLKAVAKVMQRTCHFYPPKKELKLLNEKVVRILVALS